DERVLVPRPETEGLVELALAGLPEGARILDLCAGSGCVGLTLAAERADARVDLVELEPGAAEVARANAERLGVADRCRILVGDLFAPVDGEAPYDAIVSNPPYVPSGEIPGLSREVRREPMRALDGGADGLDLVRRLVADAPRHLVPGGAIALELALGQPAIVAGMLRDAGFSQARAGQDFTRRERYAVGVR
ncbi:MAG TPA: peptide chain release factor N(5)-glutamine methyltransferase, partial [Vulgatibacter sp.]